MTNGEMAPSQLCAAPGPSGPTPADGRMRGLRSLWVATARALVCGGLVALMPSGATAQGTGGALPRIVIDSAITPPAWALAQRELIRMNGAGAVLYADAFLDAQGFLPVTPGWGVGDGPDDLTENLRTWPIAHAVGGADTIISLWQRAWEGHLRQVGQTRVPQLEMARDGIFHQEFMSSYDWEHISEGLGPFYFYGLSRPYDRLYIERMRRFAGFYLNEDPGAPNYDPEKRIIRSLFNGSRGPKLTPASVDDWDGPVGHDVDPASSRRTRFVNAGNIAGDHPLNLNVTMLPLHAFMLTGDAKYRDWVLEYVDAWSERIDAAGGNIPSNIGLDGAIGGEWTGKWYEGVFGWNSPDGGTRNYTLRGPPEAFGAALLLTGDQRYTSVLRRQFDNLFAAARKEGDSLLLPRYHGPDGWYGHAPLGAAPSGALGNQVNVLLDIYMWSLRPEDRRRLPRRDEAQLSHHPDLGWLDFLEGRAPEYPLHALQESMQQLRRTAERMQSSGNLAANPVVTTALVNLTMGAADPGGSTHGPLPLHAQVRHFDPANRRAGLPRDVAALVEAIEPERVTLTLVNINPFEARTATVQVGAYGEHLARSVEVAGRRHAIEGSAFDVLLAPGAGATLTIDLERYAHQPSLAFPWDRAHEGAPR